MTAGGSTTSAGAKAFNFNGTLQYQFKQAHALVPYAGAGLGFLHSSFETSSSILGSSFSVSGSSTDLYFNVGGGVRYFVNERWGFIAGIDGFRRSKYLRSNGGRYLLSVRRVTPES